MQTRTTAATRTLEFSYSNASHSMVRRREKSSASAPVRRKRSIGCSSRFVPVPDCASVRRLRSKLKISLQTAPPSGSYKKRGTHRFTIFSKLIPVAEIDLCSALAAMLREYLDERGTPKSELLFQSSSGKPLHQSNILRRTLHPILRKLNEPKCGCHAFRRFRITHLRRNSVPEDLIHYWVGHAGKSVTDDYSKLKEDLAFRKEVAERVGLGFELLSETISLGPNGPKIEPEPVSEMAVCA